MSAPLAQHAGRLRVVGADERLSRAANKTTVALFGPTGVGKTSLLQTLPPGETLCIDLEAGMKSVQGWHGDSVPVRCFADALGIACLVGGPDPAAAPDGFFSEAHHRHLAAAYPDLARLIAGKSIVFVDSITDLTRQAMAWAKTRPEAVSEKTGRPDTRGAYGLLARRLVCRAGNPFGLPAKDRSGRLAETEPPDLGALLRKTNATATSKG